MFTNRLNRKHQIVVLLPLIVLLTASAVFAQGPGTAFSFQGKLGDSGSPVNGTFDMQFKLFDAGDPNASNQIGTTITLNNPLVQVTNGVFTVQLDFGAAALPGADRYLEIGLRRNSTDPYTVLSPRSKITSSPYAIRSLNASGADSLSNVCSGCVQSSQINSVDASKLTGVLPLNSLPAGSNAYIQNIPLLGTNLQLADFNIAGTGSAVIFNAGAGYNIAGARVLSVSGQGLPASNTLVGVLAGTQVSPQFGLNGNANSFFGYSAGFDSHFGHDNSFFGYAAGGSNSDYFQNSFFGSGAGQFAHGNGNTFVGANSDVPGLNSTADNDTLVGFQSRVTTGLSNGTAIGARAEVTQSNSLVLGSINGTNGATADTNVGIGLTAPNNRLDVVNSSGAAQIRFGKSSADNGGYLISTTDSQAVISGGAKWNGSAFVAKSSAASFIDMKQATVRFFADDGLTADSTFTPSERMRITSTGNLGIGTTAPNSKLQVANGDVYLSNSANGIILTSPNGKCWRVTVNNRGALTSASITCP